MQRFMLKAKIHRATITGSELHYEGSLTVDRDLLDAVGIVPFERVNVYNINNGERFDTYVIEGEVGSGVLELNGAAARKGMIGDLIIIATYALVPEDELPAFAPKILLLDEKNQVKANIAR